MTSLTFHPPVGASFSAALLDIEHNADDALLVIRVAVPYVQWERVLADALFHAWFDADDMPLFESRGDIFLTLRLTPALTATLGDKVLDADTLATLTSPDPMLLFSTLAWFLVAATQAVHLPHALQSAEASLNVGGATEWYRLFNPVAEVVPPPETVVLGFFEAQEWLYEELEPTLWRLTVSGDSEQWVALVQLNLEAYFCLVYSVFPDEATNEAKRPALAAYLSGLNYDLAVGNWEIDLSDGEIRFRTSLDYEGNDLTPALFGRLMLMNIQAVETHFAEIRSRL